MSHRHFDDHDDLGIFVDSKVELLLGVDRVLTGETMGLVVGVPSSEMAGLRQDSPIVEEIREAFKERFDGVDDLQGHLQEKSGLGSLPHELMRSMNNKANQ